VVMRPVHKLRWAILLSLLYWHHFRRCIKLCQKALCSKLYNNWFTELSYQHTTNLDQGV